MSDGRTLRILLRLVETQAALILLVAFATSCTASSVEAPSSRAGSPTSSTAAPPVTDLASFLRGLETAEYSVREGKRQGTGGLFGEMNQTVFIDNVQISTYEYPSEDALQEEAGSSSEDGYSVPTSGRGVAMVEWVGSPHFFSGGTLLVLYLGEAPLHSRRFRMSLGHSSLVHSGRTRERGRQRALSVRDRERARRWERGVRALRG